MGISIQQRIFLVEYVFREGNNYSDLVQRLFTVKFPGVPLPSKKSVHCLIEKFRETGSVLDAPRCGRPSIINADKLSRISASVTRSPSKSLRKLAQEENVALATVHKVVKKTFKLFPYKVTAVQQLQLLDSEKRLRYCEWFQDFIERKTIDILDVTFFTDEAWFHLSGYINSQNSRLWSSTNPHALHETPLYDQKVGVWAAVSRRRIVGPIFFDSTINSERYCSILYEFIQLLEEDEIMYSWFQQDGATAHTAANSMQLLDEFFGERIISKNVWPPRSPDLSPLDFYLWGAAKSKVYCDRPRTLNELKTAITAFIHNITQEELRKVFDNKIKRVQACVVAKGEHFQQLL